MNRNPTGIGKLPVYFTDQLLNSKPEFVIFWDIRPAGNHLLYENHLVMEFGKPFQCITEGLQSIGYTFGIIQAIDSQDDLFVLNVFSIMAGKKGNLIRGRQFEIILIINPNGKNADLYLP